MLVSARSKLVGGCDKFLSVSIHRKTEPSGRQARPSTTLILTGAQRSPPPVPSHCRDRRGGLREGCGRVRLSHAVCCGRCSELRPVLWAGGALNGQSDGCLHRWPLSVPACVCFLRASRLFPSLPHSLPSATRSEKDLDLSPSNQLKLTATAYHVHVADVMLPSLFDTRPC
jgi:hypothetical protein